jgi:transposase
MIQDAKKNFTLIPDNVLNLLPESVRDYIAFLESNFKQQQAQQAIFIQELEKRIQEQAQKIHELEARLAKNSSNSSKPPGSDGLKKQSKTTSLRGKSGKNPGGQNGRTGKTLEQVDSPNHIVIHAPDSCQNCNFNLSDVEGICSNEKRQVFEIPEPRVEVTEHRVEVKGCPCCGKLSKGSFPENIKAPVQYGEHVQVLATYFKNEHLIPAERVCEIFEDVFGISISPGTCAKIDQKLFAKLESFETNLKAHLLAAKVLHFDETGMRCEKKLHWIHVTSSETATFYGIHAKRGQEAIDEFNILPQFHGIACHDHWIPYFAYTQVKHGLCNAHHLRELTYIHEQEKEEWAKEMKDVLLHAKKEVEAHIDLGMLPEDIQLQIEQDYARILIKGFEYHEQLPALPKGKRGKQKQRDGKNLLDRFKGKQDCVLRFMYDFSVPFTNNLAEQDVRMTKVKQKISGCFRTHKGGKIFCRIRSYISTARKQGWRIWDSLVDAIRGSPRLLEVQPAQISLFRPPFVVAEKCA